MSTKLGQEPAFPEPFLNDPSFSLSCDKGMSKRFYAACTAIQGLLASPKVFYLSETESTQYDLERKVRFAYMCADELLKQENEAN